MTSSKITQVGLSVRALGCVAFVALSAACKTSAPSPSQMLPALSGGSLASVPLAPSGVSAAGSGVAATIAGSAAPAPAGSGAAGGTVASAGSSAITGTAGIPSEVGASGAAAPPVSGSADWTMMGHDATGTFNNTAETVLTKANAASLSKAWQVDMGTNVYGAPLQVGDKIYASSGAGVKAFDASGKQLWASASGTTGSLAYDNGTLYLYTTIGNIVALDATSGMQKWSKPPKDSPGGDGSSSPVVAGNVVLIGGSNGGSEVVGGRFRGFLAALDKSTGMGLWTSYTVPANATGASLWSSAAADVAAGRAYGTTGNNHGMPATDSSDAFIGFDLASGEIKWKNQRTMSDTWSGGDTISPDADFGANPVLYEAMVGGVMTKLVSSGQKTGEAHAVQREDGKMVWTRKLCSGMNTRDGNVGIFVNGAWSGKYMLFACNSAGASQLFALDGATGDIAWMTALPGLVFGHISVANHVGFVGAGSNLIVFDADLGMILKMIPSNGGTVAGVTTISNGRVAFGEGMTWVASNVAGRMLTVLKVQ
jgi:outer membrane protein assembly factor BamB